MRVDEITGSVGQATSRKRQAIKRPTSLNLKYLTLRLDGHQIVMEEFSAPHEQNGIYTLPSNVLEDNANSSNTFLFTEEETGLEAVICADECIIAKKGILKGHLEDEKFPIYSSREEARSALTDNIWHHVMDAVVMIRNNHSLLSQGEIYGNLHEIYSDISDKLATSLRLIDINTTEDPESNIKEDPELRAILYVSLKTHADKAVNSVENNNSWILRQAIYNLKSHLEMVGDWMHDTQRKLGYLDAQLKSYCNSKSEIVPYLRKIRSNIKEITDIKFNPAKLDELTKYVNKSIKDLTSKTYTELSELFYQLDTKVGCALSGLEYHRAFGLVKDIGHIAVSSLYKGKRKEQEFQEWETTRGINPGQTVNINVIEGVTPADYKVMRNIAQQAKSSVNSIVDGLIVLKRA